MKHLHFRKSQKRVPLSPQESPDLLIHSELGDSPLKNGAQTCHQNTQSLTDFSLYDALDALCKEKNKNYSYSKSEK